MAIVQERTIPSGRFSNERSSGDPNQVYRKKHRGAGVDRSDAAAAGSGARGRVDCG